MYATGNAHEDARAEIIDQLHQYQESYTHSEVERFTCLMLRKQSSIAAITDPRALTKRFREW